MGNQQDKTGGRGQALGSGNAQASQQSQGNYRPPTNYQTQVQQQQAREQRRANLVQTKQANKNLSGLSKLEKMHNVVNYQHPKNENPSNDSSNSSPNKPNVNKNKQSQTQQQQPKAQSNNIWKAGTGQANAAEARMQAKQRKGGVANKERKDRTKELLFGDGLKEKENPSDSNSNLPIPNNQKSQSSNKNRSVSPSPQNKSNSNNVFQAAGDVASAAITRMENKTRKGGGVSKERKDRTIQLLHGDLLNNKKEDGNSNNDENESKVEKWEPDPSIEYGDMPEPTIRVKQSLTKMQNNNSSFDVTPTAKLLKKIISNILKVEPNNISDQEKYGKLRLNNPKINKAFVQLKFGLETLNSLGFNHTILPNEQGIHEEYMVYDFNLNNQEQLWYAINAIDTYYPDTK